MVRWVHHKKTELENRMITGNVFVEKLKRLSLEQTHFYQPSMNIRLLSQNSVKIWNQKKINSKSVFHLK